MPWSQYLIGFAALGAGQAAPQDMPPPIAPPPIVDAEGFPSTDTEVLDTGADRADRMTLPVMINGKGPFEFFVDTGSEATVVSRQLSEALALPKEGSAVLVGIASMEWVDLVQLDGLKLGSRTIDGLSAPRLERDDLGADGIIGLDSLRDLKVLLDFRDDTMSVVDADRGASSRGYEIVVRAKSRMGRLIVTDASVDGIDTIVIVDTGAQASIGNAELARRLRSKSEVGIKGKDVNGAVIDGKLDRVDYLRLGSIALESLPIAFSDALVFTQLDLADRPALILGMADLRAFDRVAIDFSKNRILFDVPSRFRKGSDTLGLMRGGRA